MVALRRRRITGGHPLGAARRPSATCPTIAAFSTTVNDLGHALSAPASSGNRHRSAPPTRRPPAPEIVSPTLRGASPLHSANPQARRSGNRQALRSANPRGYAPRMRSAWPVDALRSGPAGALRSGSPPRSALGCRCPPLPVAGWAPLLGADALRRPRRIGRGHSAAGHSRPLRGRERRIPLFVRRHGPPDYRRR